MYGVDTNIIRGVNIVLNKELSPDTVKPKDLHGTTVEVSEDVYLKLKNEMEHDYRGLTITHKGERMDYGEYEVEICENCKHNHYFSYFDPATYRREYDHECLKGIHGDYDVLECSEFEWNDNND